MDRKTFKKLAINNNWKSLMGNSINCTFNGRKPRNKNGKCFEIEIKNNIIHYYLFPYFAQ